MTLPNKEEMEKAREIARHFREDVAFGPLRQEALAKTIATALHEAAEEATLIERERCAKIIDSWPNIGPHWRDSAKTIRRQTKP